MHNNLLILYGGPSSEREVSFGTKDFFLELYKESNPTAAEWTADKNFIVNGGMFSEDEFLNFLKLNELKVIIASHGEYVEDGYIQEKFETNHIEFTGSDSKSCKLAMDKVSSQEKVKSLVKTIPTYKDHTQLKFPFIAKPNAKGSSVGIYLIKNKNDLVNAGKFNEDYIFQPYVSGKEVSLGSIRDNAGFLKLYPTEIIPKNSFFDYESKYVSGMSTEITPANLEQALIEKLIEINNKIHNALGLGYYSRSDYIISKSDIYYLETNALPGMTKTSLVPQQLRYVDAIDTFKEGLLKNLIRS